MTKAKPKKEFTTNVCLDCIKETGVSCCSDNPALPLMYKDIKRIEKLGYKAKDFIVPLWYTDSDVEGPEQWWKDARVEYKGKKYKLNIKKKNGVCYFLKKGKGCTLGSKRPYLCRMYPFWVNDKTGEVIFEAAAKKECNIPLKKYSVDEGLKLIKENRKNMKKFFKEVKYDCIHNQDKAKEILLKIKSKK